MIQMADEKEGRRGCAADSMFRRGYRVHAMGREPSKSLALPKLSCPAQAGRRSSSKRTRPSAGVAHVVLCGRRPWKRGARRSLESRPKKSLLIMSPGKCPDPIVEGCLERCTGGQSRAGKTRGPAHPHGFLEAMLRPFPRRSALGPRASLAARGAMGSNAGLVCVDASSASSPVKSKERLERKLGKCSTGTQNRVPAIDRGDELARMTNTHCAKLCEYPHYRSLEGRRALKKEP